MSNTGRNAKRIIFLTSGKWYVAPGWLLGPDDAAKENRMQTPSEKQRKRQKRTQFMCGKMLAWLRQDMKYEPRDMRALLGLKRRTYQDYELGKRGIPAKLATRIRELHQRDREFINGIGDRVDAAERGKKR